MSTKYVELLESILAEERLSEGSGIISIKNKDKQNRLYKALEIFKEVSKNKNGSVQPKDLPKEFYGDTHAGKGNLKDLLTLGEITKEERGKYKIASNEKNHFSKILDVIKPNEYITNSADADFDRTKFKREATLILKKKGLIGDDKIQEIKYVDRYFAFKVGGIWYMISERKAYEGISTTHIINVTKSPIKANKEYNSYK